MIEKWLSEKDMDYNDGLGRRTYAPERMGALTKKLKMFIRDTKGFEDPSAVDSVFLRFQEEHRVVSSKTKIYYCTEFKDFINFAKLQQSTNVDSESWINWRRACETMDLVVSRVSSRAQSTVSSEMSVNQEFKARAKLSKETVRDVSEKLTNLLKELLHTLETDKLEKLSDDQVRRHYKLLQCCLIFYSCE